jgi:glutamate/tyrosine decarboxylase-like PLP-dependent enzyme/quercetin dioxygenase-like cupin family protein
MSLQLHLDETETKNRRTVLHQTDFFEVVSIEWSRESISEMHNHGWSQCMVLIENGIFENTLDLGVKTELRRLETGQVLSTPVGAKHKMRCLSSTGRTLHVYTPKIEELSESGIFNVTSLEDLKKDLRLQDATRFDRLEEILKEIRGKSVSTHSPYFMNQLFSGVSPQMLLAESMISQTKTTLATFEASPAFSTIECEVIESLGEKIGWKNGSRDGIAVPGGSAANFMAVHCARQKMFPHIKQKGMSGERFKIYVSSEAHYSFKKACVALGLGLESVVAVQADRDGRMSPALLKTLIIEHKREGAIPLLVAATAGTTVLGAFDPIEEISEVCVNHGVWLHVDGAWGGPALFSRRSRHLMNGIERADSVTFDAHKLYGASLTSSFFLSRHVGLLRESNDVSGGDYLFHSEDSGVDRGKMSWQCGRKADAFSFWTIWKSLGHEGLGEFVDRLMAIRDQTVKWLENEPRLELVATPQYLNLCIRIRPPNRDLDPSDWSRKVREDLKIKNLAMVNYSTDQNGTFLRLILAHPHLQFDHVRKILEWSLEIR